MSAHEPIPIRPRRRTDTVNGTIDDYGPGILNSFYQREARRQRIRDRLATVAIVLGAVATVVGVKLLIDFLQHARF